MTYDMMDHMESQEICVDQYNIRSWAKHKPNTCIDNGKKNGSKKGRYWIYIKKNVHLIDFIPR